MSIKFKNVTFSYTKKLKVKNKILDNINLEIYDGDFVGIVGESGSGKSTLIQHMNALLIPDEGIITYNGYDINKKGYSKKLLRREVGIVFQYPEQQMFEQSVIKDVCFGPLHQGLSEIDSKTRAIYALDLMGIEKEFFEVSPFELSGGLKRRAAIAGILAAQPKVLILDEPTAGLDPQGRYEILDIIKKINKEENMTVVLISHNMEDIAEYANRMIVMHKGQILINGFPRDIFWNTQKLSQAGLQPPRVVSIMKALIKDDNIVNKHIMLLNEAIEEIISLYNREEL